MPRINSRQSVNDYEERRTRVRRPPSFAFSIICDFGIGAGVGFPTLGDPISRVHQVHDIGFVRGGWWHNRCGLWTGCSRSSIQIQGALEHFVVANRISLNCWSHKHYGTCTTSGRHVSQWCCYRHFSTERPSTLSRYLSFIRPNVIFGRNL